MNVHQPKLTMNICIWLCVCVCARYFDALSLAPIAIPFSLPRLRAFNSVLYRWNCVASILFALYHSVWSPRSLRPRPHIASPLCKYVVLCVHNSNEYIWARATLPFIPFAFFPCVCVSVSFSLFYCSFIHRFSHFYHYRSPPQPPPPPLSSSLPASPTTLLHEL